MGQLCRNCRKWDEGYLSDEKGRYFCSFKCYEEKESVIADALTFTAVSLLAIIFCIYCFLSLYWGWHFNNQALKHEQAKTELLKRSKDVTSYQGILQ